jgi:2-alkenal reductase
MRRNNFLIVAGIGCGLLIVLLIAVIPITFFSINRSINARTSTIDVVPVTGNTVPQAQIATITVAPQQNTQSGNAAGQSAQFSGGDFTALYNQVNSGVVNIQTFVNQNGTQGQAAGSGFILDDQGHILTNNHVIAGATNITVIFFDGFGENASLVGTDEASDLAVLKVDSLPQGTKAMLLGDSSAVQVGEWVMAIGNPFGLGTSMSVGVVSAVERMIESGATPYSIPQAIQTDAAINPGNSGGPLINMKGEVIGVNAQIATNGTQANSGVGFSIPSNVVRRVAPVLIANKAYQWPYLGITGSSVNLVIAQANQLPNQDGAYIHTVVPGGPAAAAGMQGSKGTTTVDGLDVPTGGDVVIDVDGQPVKSFSDLLVDVAYKNVGDTVQIVVLREGQRVPVTVTLQARPANNPDQNTQP